ncbi:muscle M-line assembly protein unc-89-like isoform X2 [Silurus meridionalis]|uniref:Ig-like domain-containing protein n=2 Tax=Silurus meridionalis TaxID=175797 RepID=A0A8T0BNY6_SILME|nr:muscle M-line assembly protein unc-89-like isoform X2 [Silurus meridionalis]KAF7709012.1 hypothetical protein HF521_018069 [Silurus meridionalis]
MSASTRTSHPKFSTVRSSIGDTVVLECKISLEISKVTREIKWFKGTECVHQEALGDLCWGHVSLTLRDVKVKDSGQYRCEAHGERKEEIGVVYLHVAGFKLVPSSQPFGFSHFFPGDDATLPCHLSPKRSAVAMEIRWFKGADCICVYQNGQMREGKDYEGRVSLFTHELKEGNLSLMLRNVQELDNGEYKCKVTHGKDKVKSDQNSLCVKELQLTPEPYFYLIKSISEASVAQPVTVHAYADDEVTLPCYLSPPISAVPMEIRWFKGTDCICVYQNGQVNEGKGFQGKVCLFIHKLEEGNVSLMLRNVQESDDGEYKCEVTCQKCKMESNGVSLHVSEFKLVSSSSDLDMPDKFYGDDVTLSCHLSPQMSAVAMEIRWFKETECICVCQNGQVNEGKGYEGRVSLYTKELEDGNVSLLLRNGQESDDGKYTCEVTKRKDKVETKHYWLRLNELKLTPSPFHFHTQRMKSYTICACAGVQVTLPCHLSSITSASAMEIRWFKGTDCICVYQNGQVNEGKGYEGRVGLFNLKLEKGNVSLMLRNVQKSDNGEYKCKVTRREHNMENTVNLHVSEFKLVHSPEDVGKSSGSEYGFDMFISDGHDEVTLPCYISPKQSAVAMEIRWFKETDCICVYQNGQVKKEQGYVGRVIIFTHKLEEGNVSLMHVEMRRWKLQFTFTK